MTNTLIEITHGSHLYGTATENSDVDIKGVHYPTQRSVLLGNVKPAIVRHPEKIEGEKNQPDMEDYTSFTVSKFLHMVAEGQTVALELLFAPPQFHTRAANGQWQEVKSLAPLFFNKQASAFIGYCRTQANKYGIKGSRVAAAKYAYEVLCAAEEEYGPHTKLQEIEADLQPCATIDHITIGETISRGVPVKYFEVCNRKCIFPASIKEARAIVEKIHQEYGKRALQAENNEGVDWKALSHAVRVGRQSVEFFQNHHIEFPLSYASHLLDIKLGKLPYQKVAEEIEQLLIDVEDEAKKSTLPDKPNMELLGDVICDLHLKNIFHLGVDREDVI